MIKTNIFFKPVGIGIICVFGFQFSLLAKKPLNILIIQTDEHNPRMFGAAGDPVAITPNIDKLTRQGVLFTNAYCQNPVSVPSRMSMLTGKYSQSIRVYGNSNPLTMKFTTLGEYLTSLDTKQLSLAKCIFRGKVMN